MFEGTGQYFLILFIIYIVVLLTVKICLGKIFEDMGIASYKAYIPFYNRILLIKKLDIKKSLFYKTLIPFANLYYYNIVIAELLKAYKLNPKDSTLFILIPMYKFPELIFKKPKFMLHMYDDTEEFISNENVLFTQEKTVIAPEVYNQDLNTIKEENTYQNNENVFTNQSMQPDERHETIIEAKEEKKEEEKPIIIDDSKPRVCPKCGTKLAPTATICFLCGTKLD